MFPMQKVVVQLRIDMSSDGQTVRKVTITGHVPGLPSKRLEYVGHVDVSDLTPLALAMSELQDVLRGRTFEEYANIPSFSRVKDVKDMARKAREFASPST